MEQKRTQYIEKIKKNYQIGVIYVLLFLCGLNFVSNIICYLMIPLLIVAFVAIDVFMIKKPQLTFDYKKKNYIIYFLIFLMFIVLYPIFVSIHNFNFSSFAKNIYHYTCIPLLFFCLGAYLYKFYGLDKLINSLLVFFLGFFVFSIGCIGNSIATSGLFNPKARIAINFWNPNELISVTLLSVYIAPFSILLLGIGFLVIKNKNFLSLIFILMLLALAIIGSASLGNRSFFVILITGFIALCIFFLKDLFKTKRSYWICLSLILFFFISMILLLIMIKNNIFGLGIIAEKIPVIKRFITGGSDSGRIKYYVNFFKNFYKKPFGGLAYSHLLGPNDYHLVHNTWLDVYTLGGIFPFISFMCISILIIKKTISISLILKNQSSVLLISTIIAICAGFLFEPIIAANPYLFGSIFMLYPLVFINVKKLSTQNSITTENIHSETLIGPTSNTVNSESPFRIDFNTTYNLFAAISLL